MSGWFKSLVARSGGFSAIGLVSAMVAVHWLWGIGVDMTSSSTASAGNRFKRL